MHFSVFFSFIIVEQRKNAYDVLSSIWSAICEFCSGTKTTNTTPTIWLHWYWAWKKRFRMFWELRLLSLQLKFIIIQSNTVIHCVCIPFSKSNIFLKTEKIVLGFVCGNSLQFCPNFVEIQIQWSGYSQLLYCFL